VLRMGKVPRYTAWRMQILNGIDWNARLLDTNLIDPGIDGLLPRRQSLKPWQKELIR